MAVLDLHVEPEPEPPESEIGAAVPVASVHDLHVTFRRGGRELHAVRGVSFDVMPGEILGIVGESGSGKSVLGLSLLGLLPHDPAPRVEGRAEVCGDRHGVGVGRRPAPGARRSRSARCSRIR